MARQIKGIISIEAQALLIRVSIERFEHLLLRLAQGMIQLMLIFMFLIQELNK